MCWCQPFTGLGAPHWKPEVRAALLGMSRGTGKPEICRAALESIAFPMWRGVACDGEGQRSEAERPYAWMAERRRGTCLMQIQADCVGVEVTRPSCLETTALGDGLLCGIASGVLEGPGGVGRVARGGAQIHSSDEDVGVDWDQLESRGGDGGFLSLMANGQASQGDWLLFSFTGANLA